MVNNLSPIIFFVYNRLRHTRQTIEALQKNILAEKSELFVFSDGPKKENDKETVEEVRKYLKSISGFKSITFVERDKNMGCANSIIAGITEIINKKQRAIVVEDDIVTSRNFLTYMNRALDFFENDKKIFSVSGYNFPPKTMSIPKNYREGIYLSYRLGAWGWGTWVDRWEKVDWEVSDFAELSENLKMQKAFNRGGDDMYDMLKAQMEGRIDAWDIRFDYSQFKHDSFNVRPIKSLVKNIGCDNSGVHCGFNAKLSTELDDSYLPNITNVAVSKQILKNFKKAFRQPPSPPRYSLKRFIKKMRAKFMGDK